MTTEKNFITLDEIRTTSTWTKKDDSTPRGCVTVSASEIKPGDKVVVNNRFVPVVDIDDEDENETTETRAAIVSASNGETIPAEAPQDVKKPRPAVDLWKATRRDDLPAYGTDNALKQEAREKSRANAYGYDRAAAEIIRNHLRKRFPGFTFSVTSGGAGYLNSVNITIKSGYAPRVKINDVDAYGYDREKDDERGALYAVYKYCDALHNAFDADDGDYYADYGAHHDLYGGVSISYSYTQTEPTEAQKKALEAFAESREAWERAEEERQRIEFEEAQKRAEIERAEAEKTRAEWEKTRAEIENHVTVEDIPQEAQTFTACDEGIGKESNIDRVRENIKERAENGDTSRLAKASRRVTFTDPALFEAFASHLLEEYTFIARKGGSATDDPRIKDMETWESLSPEQRDSVLWYACDTVAVYLNDALQFIVDPQGYDYCRYVLIPSGETVELPPQDTREFYIPAPLSEQIQNIKIGAAVAIFRDSVVCVNMLEESRGTVEAVTENARGGYDITIRARNFRTRVSLSPRDLVQIYGADAPYIPDAIRYDVNEQRGLSLCRKQRDNSEIFPLIKSHFTFEGFPPLLDTVPGFIDPAEPATLSA